jgi:hypothetical protein
MFSQDKRQNQGKVSLGCQHILFRKFHKLFAASQFLKQLAQNDDYLWENFHCKINLIFENILH